MTLRQAQDGAARASGRIRASGLLGIGLAPVLLAGCTSDFLIDGGAGPAPAGAPPAQARRAPLVIGRADAMAGAAGALGRRGDTSCAAAVTPSSSASSRAGTQPRRCAPAQRSGAAGARERGGARARH